jgi:hypothetical protein
MRYGTPNGTTKSSLCSTFTSLHACDAFNAADVICNINVTNGSIKYCMKTSRYTSTLNFACFYYYMVLLVYTSGQSKHIGLSVVYKQRIFEK